MLDSSEQVSSGVSADGPEALLAESRHGKVALDPAAGVQHLCVGDGTHVACNLVRTQRFEERRSARPTDVDLGER